MIYVFHRFSFFLLCHDVFRFLKRFLLLFERFYIYAKGDTEHAGMESAEGNCSEYGKPMVFG